MNTRTATASSPAVPAATAALRMLAYSSLGLVMFFLPVEIAGKSTILFDHAATWLATQQRPLAIAFVLALMAWGAASPVSDALPAGRGRWQAAWDAGMHQARSAPSIWRVLAANLRDGIAMASAVVPTILAVGLIGLLLARYTPVFDLLGLLLVPFVWVAGLAEPMLTAKALASGLAEMFLPAIQLKGADAVVRYVAAVVSVSSVLFFSGSIPCVLATRIPLSLRQMVAVWFVRTVLSLLMAAAIGHFALAQGWIA